MSAGETPESCLTWRRTTVNHKVKRERVHMHACACTLHTHTQKRIEAKTLGRDMDYSQSSFQQRRQRDEIKGDFSEVEHEQQDGAIPGWMRPAASCSHHHLQQHSSQPLGPSVTEMIFFPKRCYIEKNKISKGI